MTLLPLTLYVEQQEEQRKSTGVKAAQKMTVKLTPEERQWIIIFNGQFRIDFFLKASRNLQDCLRA